jgi:hypothetical protein
MHQTGSPARQSLLQSMIEEGAFGFSFLTQPACRELGVTFSPETATSLTGRQKAGEILIGDVRAGDAHDDAPAPDGSQPRVAVQALMVPGDFIPHAKELCEGAMRLSWK